MKNLFTAYLKKVFSDLHSAILGIILAALILGAGGIWVFSKNLWILLKTTMLLPTPLWVITIFLALFVLAYIYKTSRKPQAFKPGDEWCPERCQVKPGEAEQISI